MNQQEIKRNLPRLPYWVNKRPDIEIQYVKDDTGDTVCTVDTECGENCDTSISLAITHAINNTYGKGINPESVSEMYNALQIVHRYLTNIGSFETAMNIQDILNKAAL